MPKDIAHLNITGFRAAVAALKDNTLQGRPYVITGGRGGRAAAFDVSPEALCQNIIPGMALAAAQRIVKDLVIVPPDPAAYQKANSVIETIINRYAPLWQNDARGNLYLDITGTRNLFGPPAHCVCRVQNEIIASLCLKAAAATATNKLVSKVASRAIRPLGLIEVRPGDEAAFLAHQDITLLPGIGPSLLKTIRLTGFREAGELAVLPDAEAISLFGKKGILLRDIAMGIDNSPVSGGNRNQSIEKRADFSEDRIDAEIIRGLLVSLAEQCGLEMRREKRGTSAIRLKIMYSDGGEAEGVEKTKRLLVTDNELSAAVHAVYKKIANRRIRIRSICLGLEDLSPLAFQPDLFEPDSQAAGPSEGTAKKWRLQNAIDVIKERYGEGKITRGILHGY